MIIGGIYMSKKKSKSLFTIRKKVKEKHPQIIVGASKTEFQSISLTHSEKDGSKTNIKLKHNPNKNDNKVAYVKRKIIRDFKFRFSKAFKNYKLSNEDIDELIEFLNQKKKK